MLHISDVDLYFDKGDVEDTIEGLISLKEKIEAAEDVSAIDTAVDILYELIEEAG